jgi:long-chain fatty acid transport protein
MYLAPFVGGSSSFGLKDWRFAMGVFGPSANGIFSLNEDPAGEGPRRPHHYLMQDMEVLMAFYTLSAAYGRNDKWSVGVSLHWVDLMYADITMWVNAYDPDLGQNGKSSFFREDGMDVQARIHASDHFNFAATIGGWYKPIDGLELGLSMRVPNINFKARGYSKLHFEDELIQTFYEAGLEKNDGDPEGLVAFTNDGSPTGSKVPSTMAFSYPMTARFGIRYAHEVDKATKPRELFDIELDVVWEGWSVLKEYAVTLDDYMELLGSGFTASENGKSQFPFQKISIPRHYRDTWSFRLGGDINPLDWLTLRLGTYLETGAIPAAYTNVDFASYNRIATTAGLSFSFRIFKLSLAYAHVFQATRELSQEQTRVYTSFALHPDPPTDTKYAVGAGTYKASYDLFSAALSVDF